MGKERKRVSTRARTEASLTNRQQELIRVIGASHPFINATVLHKLALLWAVEFDNNKHHNLEFELLE